ncbi:hypothetical protein LTQ55_03845 [Mycobacterium intracellulare]|uniref:hypothetical protein n=1 Tax=Mycobacterium intracellulare TaxID=1767 RepID=UPI001E287CB6|nr:hypothetical protein [Mycobacterium intracellulare]UGT97779.1 hypothetical protein LTQ55_03845 [Mycobacterium intracellulare]
MGELTGPGGTAWLGQAFRPDAGEVDRAVDAVVCDAQGGPVFPASEGGFDVVEQDAGPADGDFIAVVAAMSVCDHGDELSGPVEDARVVAGGEVAPEAQLAGLGVGGVDRDPKPARSRSRSCE